MQFGDRVIGFDTVLPTMDGEKGNRSVDGEEEKMPEKLSSVLWGNILVGLFVADDIARMNEILTSIDAQGFLLEAALLFGDIRFRLKYRKTQRINRAMV